MGTWKSQSSIAVTSSRIHKHSIEPLDDRYLTLFNELSPVRFKYNEGISDRYHTGLILDELKAAMDKACLDTSELSAYCLANIYKPDGDGGIRYSDLIAIIIAKL